MIRWWRLAAIGLVAVNGLLLGLRAMAPAPAPDEGRLPPPDPDIPRARLVHEVHAVSDGEQLCFTIGPLPGPVQQRRARERLEPFASAIRERRTGADRDRGWWVYLPTASRQAALELARELAAADMEDFYVVVDGDDENAVSLGLFRDRENARQRLARVRSMGYDAQLGVRREDIPQYWVDYRIAPDERSPWRFILRGAPGAVHRPVPCF